MSFKLSHFLFSTSFFIKLILILVSIYNHLYASSSDSPLKAQQLQFLFVNPGIKPDPFWDEVESVMVAAAFDLKIDLKIIEGKRNHIETIHQIEDFIKAHPQLKAILFPAHKKNGPEILLLCEKYKIKAMIFNAGLTKEQTKLYGGPREKFQQWIGQVLPDDEKAGQVLTEHLIERAKTIKLKIKKINPSSPLEMIAITGNPADGASMNRTQGMLKALSFKYPTVQLRQIVPGHWEKERAKKITKTLLHRYPRLSIIWTASDHMALGVIEQIEEMSKQQPNLRLKEEIMVGGFDWSREIFDPLTAQKLAVSLGGHFFDGAWALVLLYDYFHQQDFMDEGVTFFTHLVPLNPLYLYQFDQLESRSYSLDGHKNIHQNSHQKNSHRWSHIDFTQFSKSHGQLKKYQFTIESILQLSNGAAKEN